ncbi:hypothetical protein Bbelb_433470 [Branchiostoma belcheri]|nr:hypothetical protein Bbelb_433470 [Branchiostoma belcheri]
MLEKPGFSKIKDQCHSKTKNLKTAYKKAKDKIGRTATSTAAANTTPAFCKDKGTSQHPARQQQQHANSAQDRGLLLPTTQIYSYTTPSPSEGSVWFSSGRSGHVSVIPAVAALFWFHGEFPRWLPGLEVADSRRNTVATPNASTTLTTSGNQPVDASLPATVYSPVSERDFPPWAGSVLPPRAERECGPAVALQQPLPPDRATRNPADSDSSLGIQFRVVGTGHSRRESRHGTQRRLSKRETVGQFRVSEVVGTVGQSQNLGRKTVGQFYGISLPLVRGCWAISKRETVGQFRVPEVLETVGQSQNLVSDNLKGGWRWRADFGSLLIVFWSLGDYRQQEERQ